MSSLYSHNQEIYDGIIRAIADGYKKIGYTEATGLGKSFVFIELCKTIFKGKRILYVVPKVCISEAITFYKEYEFISDYVDFTTYAMFNSEDKALEFAEKYDVLVADECHHLLSDIQGCNVDICGSLISDKVGGFYLGMTASYLVKGENVLNKFFDYVYYGNDLYNAIIKGLFPKMNYCISLPDLDKIVETFAIKYNIDCSKSMISKILLENTVHKVLMFFSNKFELLANLNYIDTILNGYKVFTLYSGELSTKENMKVLSDFNDCSEDCVLLSVSMLLEGVHVKGVDCAIIYRNVTQLHTLEQLIGRLFHYGMNKSPLVIDVTSACNLFISDGSKNTNTGKEGIGGKFKFKDVINPICGSYKVVDFVEDYLKSLHWYYVNGYRGIYSNSISSLSEALGIPSYVLKNYYYKNKVKSVNDLIDYYLDVYKYGIMEYPDREGSYRGIKYPISVVDLSERLKITENILRKYIYSTSNVFTNIVDFYLDGYKSKIKWRIDKPYKGIPIFSTKDEFYSIASSIGLSMSWIKDCREGATDIYDVLDKVIIKRDAYKEGYKLSGELKSFWVSTTEYRGIVWETKKELAQKLGVTSSYLYIIKQRLYESAGDNITVCSIIDYFLDSKNRNLALKEEYRGVKPFKNQSEFGRLVGISFTITRRIIKKYNISNGRELVDCYYDKYLKGSTHDQ